MNVKRFTARTSRDALGLVKEALGHEAMVLSTRPCADGVEVLAMAPDALPGFDDAPSAPPIGGRAGAETTPAQDAERLAMSTLSFLDYVRERMLRRRRAEMQEPPAQAAAPPPAPVAARPAVAAGPRPVTAPALPGPAPSAPPAGRAAPPQRTSPPSDAAREPSRAGRMPEPAPEPEDGFRPFVEPARDVRPTPTARAGEGALVPRGEPVQMLRELRDVRSLIEQRFGELAYLDKLKRDPRQAQLLQRLLEAGFSPGLSRRLSDGLPAGGNDIAWAANVLVRNLQTGEREAALEDAGGVYALIGPTGVGKTTSTAKLAAAFAARHGAGHLGLITLDAYRVAAHEQLRAYGKILGVPVYTAHDRASLEDLLDLLSAKRMVLIDTAGMAQRDERTRELLDMLGHRQVQRLLVINATSQGETIEDVISAYHAAQCRGVVLSKLDEAVKLGPALDALIRHKLKVLAVGNGQRVPEDWHRLAGATLVQRALSVPAQPAWKLNAEDVKLAFVDTRHAAGRE
jgi:flagellar biosynthesis protein FlhF